MNKYNLLIPIAGDAKRFREIGYTTPKPLIMVKDQHMIDLSLSCIDITHANLIFCVRKEHIQNFSIDIILKKKYGNNIKIVVVDKLTDGTLITCRLAERYIDNQVPLCIYTPDIYFQYYNDYREYDWLKFKPQDERGVDGYLLTFKANNPAHSYIRTDDDSIKVLEVAEKQVIGPYANIGFYGFKSGHDFIQYSDIMIRNPSQYKVNNEYYIAPIYNLMIKDNKKVIHKPVSKVHVLGTPEDLDFYVENVCKRFGDGIVALCADHSGFKAKELMKEILKKHAIHFLDFGTFTDNDCDQYDFLSQAISHIQRGICDFGMSFCRTGQAMNMGANHVKGIRSALIYDDGSARYAIKHNCANFFSIPAAGITSNFYDNIVLTLRNTSFDGGRHTTRLRKLEQLYGL